MTAPRTSLFQFSLRTMFAATAAAAIVFWALLRWPVYDVTRYDEFRTAIKALRDPTASEIVIRVLTLICCIGVAIAWVRVYSRQKQRRHGTVERQPE